MARFGSPSGICLSNESGENADTLLVCDTWNNRIRRVNRQTGWVVTAAGSGRELMKNGHCDDAAFVQPNAICADPVTAGVYYIGSTGTIRKMSGEKVELFACGSDWWDAEPQAFRTTFSSRVLQGLICPRNTRNVVFALDAQQLLQLDGNTRKCKAVTLDFKDATGTHTLNGLSLCWDRSATAVVDSSLFVLVLAYDRWGGKYSYNIARVNVTTSKRVSLSSDIDWSLCSPHL